MGITHDHEDNQQDSRLHEDGDVVLRTPPKRNGFLTHRTYTGFRPETSTLHHKTSAPVTIVQLDYGYNKLHDRTFERYGGSGSTGDAFGYDKARRLTAAWMGSATPASPSGAAYVRKIDYNYDDDGNRTSVVTTLYGQSPSTSSYTTNSMDLYTGVGGTSQTFDSNGNLADDGTNKFKYNYKNQLCEVRLVANNALVATYKYDSMGRRVEKDVSGGSVVRFIYSSANLVSTYSGPNTWSQDFVFGQGSSAPLALSQADVLDYDSDSNLSEVTRAFYHCNPIGSVLAISDMSQATTASYRYGPYGEATITRNGQVQSTDPLGQPWTFEGLRLDGETGLLHSLVGAYLPAQGRALQLDLLGAASSGLVSDGFCCWPEDSGARHGGVPRGPKNPKDTFEVRIVVIVIGDDENLGPGDFAPAPGPNGTVHGPFKYPVTDPNGNEPKEGIIAIWVYIIEHKNSDGSTHTIRLYQIFVKMPANSEDGERGRLMEEVFEEIKKRIEQIKEIEQKAWDKTHDGDVPITTMMVGIGHDDDMRDLPWPSIGASFDFAMSYSCCAGNDPSMSANAWHTNGFVGDNQNHDGFKSVVNALSAVGKSGAEAAAEAVKRANERQARAELYRSPDQRSKDVHFTPFVKPGSKE